MSVGGDTWCRKDTIEEQAKDKFCSSLKHDLTKGALPDTISDSLVEDDSDYEDEDDEQAGAPDKAAIREASKIAKVVILMAPHFTVTTGGLLLKLHLKKGFKHQELAQELQLTQQICLPQSAVRLRERICFSVHKQAGHPGALKTYQILQKTLSWGGIRMHGQVVDMTKHCATCQCHSYKAPAAPTIGHTIMAT